MNESPDILKKAREELRKQFIDYASIIAKGFKREAVYSEALGKLDQLRTTIDALDHAIDGAWANPKT